MKNAENVRMLVDRLFIEQNESNIVVTNESDGGIRIEDHFVAPDNSDGVHIITLSAVEKKKLIEFLTENQV